MFCVSLIPYFLWMEVCFYNTYSNGTDIHPLFCLLAINDGCCMERMKESWEINQFMCDIYKSFKHRLQAVFLSQFAPRLIIVRSIIIFRSIDRVSYERRTACSPVLTRSDFNC